MLEPRAGACTRQPGQAVLCLSVLGEVSRYRCAGFPAPVGIDPKKYPVDSGSPAVAGIFPCPGRAAGQLTVVRGSPRNRAPEEKRISTPALRFSRVAEAVPTELHFCHSHSGTAER